MSSRYKNAKITAIDLSSSSLAYAIRKSMEYKINNATFKQMDLINVAELGNIFDIIECSGVLHHMEKPSKGLSALIQKLKPGRYIKLGLYSEIARKVIVEARKIIKTLGINSTPEGIRNFRMQVLAGEIKELQDLPKCGRDFYSLSECHDLCFHVQEHQFTTETLEKLLEAEHLVFCGSMLPKSINISEHVSILGLQTFAGRFPKANEEKSNQQQKPLLPSTNGNESFFLPETSRPFGGFHHQDIVQYFAD